MDTKNLDQKYLTDLYYSKQLFSKFEPIPQGHTIVFNGNGCKDCGIADWARVQWLNGEWWVITEDWRSDEEKARIIEQQVIITAQHAHSLAALVKHWKQMIDCLGQANCELSKEYCDELLEDLRI